jgi:tripartite-type tricarboxylate transporter receptor subunit TctC
VLPSSRYKTFADLVAYAKANPEAVRIGHAGNGTTNHLAILKMEHMLGVKLTAVPYRGSTPAISDLLGGNIDAVVDQLPSSLGQLRSGALRPLAVTSLKRARDLPEVQTLDELGLKGFEVVTGSGMLAPAKTPPAVVKVLGDALQKVLADPEVEARLKGLGVEMRRMTPDQYDALLLKEDAAAAQMIKDGLLTAQ